MNEPTNKQNNPLDCSTEEFKRMQAEMKQWRKVFLRHPLLNAALQQAELAIEAPAGSDGFAVFGPTGVGKSTLAKLIGQGAHEIFMRCGHVIQPGDMPVVTVTVPAPINGRPEWRSLFAKTFAGVNQAYGVARGGSSAQAGFDGRSPVYSMNRMTTQGLRDALVRALLFRNTKLLLFDEAQHLTAGLNPARLACDMDNLKNLAEESKCMIGYLGTYGLTPLCTGNGQLSRRLLPIHFPRYSCENAELTKRFDAVLAVISASLPIVNKGMILEQRALLHERSLGCIGILMNWLDSASWLAIRLNRGVLTPELLLRSSKLLGAVTTIRDEITGGEAAYRWLVTGESNLLSAPTQPPDKSKGRKSDVGKCNLQRFHVAAAKPEGDVLEEVLA